MVQRITKLVQPSMYVKSIQNRYISFFRSEKNERKARHREKKNAEKENTKCDVTVRVSPERGLGVEKSVKKMQKI